MYIIVWACGYALKELRSYRFKYKIFCAGLIQCFKNNKVREKKHRVESTKILCSIRGRDCNGGGRGRHSNIHL